MSWLHLHLRITKTHGRCGITSIPLYLLNIIKYIIIIIYYHYYTVLLVTMAFIGRLIGTISIITFCANTYYILYQICYVNQWCKYLIHVLQYNMLV